MKAVLNWARRETLLADLTGPLKKDEDCDGSESYEAFTTEDLKAMFECDEYRQNSFKRASGFWLPLLGLYTGARIAELAEVRLTHIGEENGVFGVKLSAEGKKAGKNKFSKRFVPIHPALLSCGFDLYVSTLRNEGHEQLFPCLPDVKPPKNKGDTGSNDFTKFRRRLGIGGAKNETSKKVFHSFRSTLTTRMQDAGVPQYLREEFDGHAPTGVNATVYSQGQTPRSVLLDALQKVAFDFKHPIWSDTDQYRRARAPKLSKAASVACVEIQS
jgi:integrase